MLLEMWNLFLERRDFFLRLLLEHIEISLAAIVLAIVFGGIMGIFISEYDRAAKPALGIINFLYTIPSISMLGFLIPFSGIGNATAIIALTVYALLPMVKNTHTGLTNVDAGILEAAKGMGSTQRQVLIKIKLPLAMPVVMSGIRSMVTMTIALAGIASFIGAGGLGVAIYRGITTNNTAMTMDGSLLIALLALLTDFLLGAVEKRIAKRSSIAKGGLKTALPLVFLVIAAVVVHAAASTGNAGSVRIATKPMTEQYILGEMLKDVIEQDTDLTVELTQGIGGGTSNIQPAMENGEFDLYPEYTGTGWNQVLKREGLYSEALFDELQDSYHDSLDMTWTGMYGFNDTYGLAVRREIAEQYGLRSYSDLAAVADGLIFGAEYDFFEREDGYDALCAAYHMSFGKTMDLDIGLKYQALNQEKIDVMVIFTTDGQLSQADAVVLEDDLGFYPSYLCGNVVRNAVLEEHPELQDAFDRLTGIITDADMAAMNYAVESEGQEPADVAERFLREKGALK
ncbi:MAG: ABC transporter permease subunit [Oscillibacter sp.]|nr:ABC transporter permease subunit [Oscillibacter sp.]